MELREIDNESFDSFVYNNEKAHFMQTSAWGKVAMKRRQKVYHLALMDNGEIKATALVLEKKILYYSIFYCPRGFIIDYQDEKLLKIMVEEIKKFTKSHHGLYLRIDPDLILHKLDNNAEVIYEDEDNLSLIDNLKTLGARHKGFTIRFADSSNPRFTFRLNLDSDLDDIFSHFHPTTKNILKRNNPYNLKIYKGSREDVKDFYKTMEETSKRKEIVLEPYAFFDDFYTVLNEEGMSDIYVAKLDVLHLKEVYRQKEKNLLDELAICTSENASSRQKKKVNDLNDQLKKVQKEAQLVADIKEDELVLSSVITAKYKDKVWIVHGGNSDILQFVNANYELYYQVIKDAKNEGYRWVDFFGAEGIIDKKSSLYGITLFKMRFGGDYDEFIGEFDFIVRPLMNKIILTLLNIRRKYYIRKAEKNK